MKKIMVILGVLAVVLFASICYFFNYDYDNNTYISSNSNKKNILKEESLSMLFETEEGSGEYEMVTRSDWPTDGYIFNPTLSKCENGGELAWDDEKKLVTMTGIISDKCYAYFDKINILTLADYVISQYNGIQGNNNIYYHNGGLTNGISDYSYRYTGASDSVKNYVCFGSDDAICPDDNLYRIIGVFDGKVKLIKATAATSTLLGTDGDYSSNTSYYWNYKNDIFNYNNTWSTSLLNTINLNTNFISYLDKINKKWAEKIATTTWKVGGNTYGNITSTAAEVYQKEIKSPVSTYSTDGKTEYSAKIGLMYVSDYGYAASSSAWTTKLSSYNSSGVTAVNWMYIGVGEWTISRRTDVSDYAYYVNVDGIIAGYSVKSIYAVRPTFYLNEKVIYKSGFGLYTDPIRLVL